MDRPTRDKLIDAAEALFAEQGFHQTSMREITAAADANLASVNYHFGNKVGLLLAVLRARIEPINRERVRLLDLLERAAGDRAPEPRAVLHAFLDPIWQFRSACPHVPALLARIEFEDVRSLVSDALPELFRDTIERFAAVLARALPGIPASLLAGRLLLTIGAFHFAAFNGHHLRHAMSDGDHPGVDDAAQHDAALQAMLIDFCDAGIRAPIGDGRSSREESSS